MEKQSHSLRLSEEVSCNDRNCRKCKSSSYIVRQSCKPTSSISYVLDESRSAILESKKTNCSYHLPCERLHLVQRLLREPFALSSHHSCSCNRCKTLKRNSVCTCERASDHINLLQNYSLTNELSYNCLTPFHKINAQLLAYKITLEQECQANMRHASKENNNNNKECAVQVSNIEEHKSDLHRISSIRSYQELEKSQQNDNELESVQLHENGMLLNLISPLSESTLYSSKSEPFREGQDGRPITAVGHLKHKSHYAVTKLTQENQEPVWHNNDKIYNTVNEIYNNDDDNNNNNSKISNSNTEKHNKNGNSYSSNNNTLISNDEKMQEHLVVNATQTTLADYMWCNANNNKGNNNKTTRETNASRTNDHNTVERNANTRNWQSMKSARQSTTSYSTENDLTSAEEILQSENEQGDVYLYVNPLLSPIKAAEHAQSQTSVNEPFVSLNLPELKHSTAVVTPSITALTNNTEEDTETDTTPTGRIFCESEINDRCENVTGTFSLTSHPQSWSTNHTYDSTHNSAEKKQLFTSPEEEREEQEFVARPLTLSSHEMSVEYDNHDLTIDAKHPLAAHRNNKEEVILTTPIIPSPSNSIIPLCSPPACDSTGVRESSATLNTTRQISYSSGNSSSHHNNNANDNRNDNDYNYSNMYNTTTDFVIAIPPPPQPSLPEELLHELEEQEEQEEHLEAEVNAQEFVKKQENEAVNYLCDGSKTEHFVTEQRNNTKISVNAQAQKKIVTQNLSRNVESCNEKQIYSSSIHTPIRKDNEICNNNNNNNNVNTVTTSNLHQALSTDTRDFIYPPKVQSAETFVMDSRASRLHEATAVTQFSSTVKNEHKTEELKQHEEEEEEEDRCRYHSGFAFSRVNSLYALCKHDKATSSAIVTKLHKWMETLHNTSKESTNIRHYHHTNSFNKDKNSSKESENRLLTLDKRLSLTTSGNNEGSITERPASEEDKSNNCGNSYTRYHRPLSSRLPSRFHAVEMKSERIRFNMYKYKYVKETSEHKETYNVNEFSKEIVK